MVKLSSDSVSKWVFYFSDGLYGIEVKIIHCKSIFKNDIQKMKAQNA